MRQGPVSPRLPGARSPLSAISQFHFTRRYPPAVVAAVHAVTVGRFGACPPKFRDRRTSIGFAARLAADLPGNRALDRPVAAVAQLHAQPPVLDQLLLPVPHAGIDRLQLLNRCLGQTLQIEPCAAGCPDANEAATSTGSTAMSGRRMGCLLRDWSVPRSIAGLERPAFDRRTTRIQAGSMKTAIKRARSPGVSSRRRRRRCSCHRTHCRRSRPRRGARTGRRRGSRCKSCIRRRPRRR